MGLRSLHSKLFLGQKMSPSVSWGDGLYTIEEEEEMHINSNKVRQDKQISRRNFWKARGQNRASEMLIYASEWILSSRKHGGKLSIEVLCWTYSVPKNKLIYQGPAREPVLWLPVSGPAVSELFMVMPLMTAHLGFKVSGFGNLVCDPPHFPPPRKPTSFYFDPLLCSASKFVLTISNISSKWPPSLFMCVFVFSYFLRVATTPSQVQNLEDCEKIDFSPWKEIELAPCIRQAGDRPISNQ